jgi:thiamine-monophosphate kinase
MTLQEAGENALLARLLPSLAGNRAVVVGAGDDCAVVRSGRHNFYDLLKTDCVVERVHFDPNTAGLRVGWKAMARPLSDFAAMSGLPRFALVTLLAPARTKVERIAQIYRGLNKAAARFDVAIVGGETSSTPGPLTISVSLTGEVERARCVLRSGASAGDDLFVTGRLGGSRSRKHLSFTPRIEEARWLTKNFSVHAMIDLSDGLGADLPRLAAASGVGFELIEEAVPRSKGCTLAQASSDGEDYELLFAAGARDRETLLKEWRKRWPNLPLTQIGRLVPRRKARRVSMSSGYEHFKKR